MPYYCTVPRCTSMAGKAKNVSFHQFPKDEGLAEQWNTILKRGKPYTKYSKVCSLHFKAEDYTITSVGKNKGQWRTLRKDAIPSRNLPLEYPAGTTHHSSPGTSPQTTTPDLTPALADPQLQQQMAQAIYMQTMLAIHAANFNDQAVPTGQTEESTEPNSTELSNLINKTLQSSLQTPSNFTEIQDFILNANKDNNEIENSTDEERTNEKQPWYKCELCSKCFKDPDVFTLHKRSHQKPNNIEEEISNFVITKPESTLKSNPILANLLSQSSESQSALGSLENQLMAAMAINMQAYITNLKGFMANNALNENSASDDELDDSTESNERLIINES